MLVEIQEKKTRERRTYEDYAKLPDYPRYELLDGDFIMTPAQASIIRESVSSFLIVLPNIYLITKSVEPLPHRWM
jgi:hypothetical protein